MAWQALKAHRGRQAEERLATKRWEDHGLVFPTEVGTPMEPRNLNRLWASLRTKVGMDDVKLHDLRHTMVTLLLDLGTPPHIVQVIARHADVEVTMRIYAHANLDEMRKAVGQLG